MVRLYKNNKSSSLYVHRLVAQSFVAINTFNSINEAGEYLGKNPSHISSCCTGKRRTAFGFVWKYLNN